jgi:phosphate-selective porin OprO/OprP
MKTATRTAVAALAGGAVWALALGAQAAETVTIEELDQKVKILERKLEIAEEESAKKAKEAPVVKADKDGFSLAATDKSFQLKLRGYLQGDGRFFLEDDDEKASDTFLIRRARVIIDGTLGKRFEFRIAPDFGNGQSQLQDGYIDYKGTPLANLRFGRTKPTIGLERLQSSADTVFNETGPATALTPNYDVGVLFYGSAGSGVVDYAAGVFNGGPDGASIDSDPNDAKDFVGRLWLTPFKNSGAAAVSGLSFGLGGSIGDQEGSSGSPGLPSYKTSGQQTFFSYRTSTNAADTAYADGERTRIAPQFYYAVGPIGLLGEYIISEQEVANGKGSDSLKNEGWQTQVSYVLTGESPSLKGIQPIAPFDPSAGQWGAIELALRLGELDIDDAAFDGKYADPKKSASSEELWGLALNWYLTKNAKFAVDYEQTKFDGGAADGDRPDEKLILARVQVSY